MHAQINGINSIFNQPNYSFFSSDSNNYLLDGCNDYNTLVKQIDSLCPFTTNEFYGNLNNINVDTTLNLMYGLHNQVPWHDTLYTECKFKFNYNNKPSHWYGFYKKSTINNENAFIMIPGSGTFQSLKLAEGDPTNYHNLNGNTRAKCLQYGDLYVYNKINEEYRSFWRMITPTNYKRLDYDYLTTYTDLNGNHWAANMYIEIIAAIKTLKKKYKNVFIMGLSSGGFPALLCGILGKADGINCAAGISSWSYNGFQIPTLDQPYFSNLLDYYTFDSLHNLISNSQSRYLFSYGSGDGGGNNFEYITHSIEDSINSDCNSDYFYNFYGHTFPTGYYDTFFTKVIKTPKVKISNFNPNSCNTDSMKLKIDFTGTAPFSYNLYRNDSLIQNYISNTNSIIIDIFTEGNYYLKNVIDNNNIPLCKSESYIYKKSKKLSYTITQNGYLCNQYNDSLTFKVTGDLPISFTKIENNILSTILLSDSINGIKTNNGYFIFQSISDTNNCLISINDTIITNIDSMNANFSNQYYNCNNNSTILNFNLNGKKPFSINYQLNGNNLVTTTNNQLYSFSASNGIYNFISISDSNNCTKQLNQVFNIDNYPLTYSISNPVYNCDSNKSKIHFELQGNAPWTIYFQKNNIIQSFTTTQNSFDKFFSNGDYIFDSIKDSTCFKLISPNLQHIIYNEPISFLATNPIYNCDSNKALIHFNFTGKAPFTIQYTQNGIANQFIINQNSIDKYFSNGTYLFTKIIDANLCESTINQIQNINFNPLNYSISNPVYSCDSNKSKIHFELQGNAPWTIYYQKNSALQTFTTTVSSFDKYFDNGDYIFDSIKDATCIKNISPTIQHNFYNNSINFQASNPLYICDSSKALIHFNLQGNPPFTVHYTQNGIANQFTTNQNSLDQFYTNNIYNFSKIVDATQCELNFNELKNINYDTLGYQLSNPIYVCDSNKSKIQFTLIGNSPWTIYYRKDNILQSFTTTVSTIEKYFDNGNYIFDSIKDFNCKRNILPSIQHSFNYNPTTTNLSTAFYNCDSNKANIQFNFQGAAPYTLYYTQNGFVNSFSSSVNSQNKLFNNGIYYFINSIDANGCNVNINEVKSINYDPLNYNFSTPIYNCDSNKTKINITLTGNSPWTIYYRLNNVTQTFTTSNTLNEYFFTNGIYQFDSVKDATCIKNITSINYNFNYNPISVSSQNPIYNCDSNKSMIHFNINGNAPYSINYTKDGIVNNITTSLNSFNQLFTNGFYYFFNVTDNTNCTSALNQLFNLQYDTLECIIDPPIFDCDLVKTKFQFHLQGNSPWTIYYRKNNIQNSFTTTNPNHSILITNGVYNFDSISDATCSKTINPSLNYTINNSLLNVVMDTPIYDCNVNKVKVHFQFQGNAPWKIHYYKIGVPPVYNTFTTYSNVYDAYFNTGNYIIDSITDNSNCTKVFNTYVNNDYSPIGFQKTGTIYNCDSNKTQINYHFNGDAPWIISILNLDSNSIFQKQTNTSNYSLFLNNGNYVIQSVTDYKCTSIINDTLHLNLPKLISTISAEAVSCDSNKMYVIINATSGNAPYTYKYFQNNILQNKISYTSTDTFYLENGAYFFEKMSDSIGCEVIFNKNVNVEYIPFYINGISTKYNCEKDSTLISFDISNYDDVFLQYTKDNSPITTLTIPYNKQDYYFSNGDYFWLNAMDSIGCKKDINQQLNINNEPIGIKKDSLIKDCENREYTYQFSFDGKSPWKLNYNKNNIFHTETFYDSINHWTVPAGKYYFINVIDSNLCSIDILRQDTLIDFLNQNPIIEFSNNIFTATSVPHIYTWYKDNVVIPNETKNQIRPYGNGVYSASVTDSAGCLYNSNKIIINYPTEINLYPNPSSDKVNILINGNYGEYWEYTLHDMFGNQVGHEIVSTPFREINVSHLTKGVYHFMINYSDDYISDKHIIRFIKN